MTEPVPAAWSLHCGGACSKNNWTTTVFETLQNPLLRNLTEKNRERYKCNRKTVVSWVFAGWPETQERIRSNRLIFASNGSLKEFAQLLLEVAGLGTADKPTTDELKKANQKHLEYLKRQFPELLHIGD